MESSIHIQLLEPTNDPELYYRADGYTHALIHLEPGGLLDSV